MASGSIHIDEDGNRTLNTEGDQRLHNDDDDCPICCGRCCHCDTGSDHCCYHADDVLTLTVDVVYDVSRICSDRCIGTDELSCIECEDFSGSKTYHLFECTEAGVTFEIDAPDDEWPTYISRLCGEDGWSFLTSGSVIISISSLPMRDLCSQVCEYDPFLCIGLDTCDLILTCDCNSECNEASPPAPYEFCSNDQGETTDMCYCEGNGCYSLDYKEWSMFCHMPETGECEGDGTEQQIVRTLTVTFDITHNCEWNEEDERCELIA